MFRSKAVFISLLIELSLVGVICGQLSSHVNNEKARYVLSKMIESRAKMRNLQFDVNSIFWSNTMSTAPGISTSIHENTLYSTYKIVMDCNGREKRDVTQYLVYPEYSSGKKNGKTIITGKSFTIQAWDGDASVKYMGIDRSPSSATINNSDKIRDSAIISKSEPSSLKHQFQPWRAFTGTTIRFLTEVIDDANYPVSVETLPDGKYQISHCRPGGNEHVSIIDPEKGFSCIKMTTFRNGIEQGYNTVEYEEFTDGLWFPVKAEDICKSDNREVVQRSTIILSNIKVNDPNFTKDLFHVNLPKGTLVMDEDIGIQYVVGDSLSVKDSRGGIAPSKIAMDTLEELIQKDDENNQLFIPNVDIAFEKKEPFVLDFSDGKLLYPLQKPESKESNKYLTELGKGDIAWDGTVVATRGAKVFTIKQESGRPLKFTEGKWTGSYKLLEKVELPYSMLVVTNEGVNYLLTIKKIESDGIMIIYRELNPDELILYKQKK